MTYLPFYRQRKIFEIYVVTQKMCPSSALKNLFPVVQFVTVTWNTRFRHYGYSALYIMSNFGCIRTQIDEFNNPDFYIFEPAYSMRV